jgi:adenosylcobinamide-phosphate synthase
MRGFSAHALGTAAGFVADLLTADPERHHPVAAFGRAAVALERPMWRDSRAAGAAHTTLCVAATAGAVAALCRASRRLGTGFPGRFAVSAGVTWSVLGGTSLAREAGAVAAALEAGDLETARRRLPHLCGRDPQALDTPGVARAVVESVAENTSDAVVGALVWGAFAGAPGMAAYRAVNTLDAMVGHRSPRYSRFGWAAARLDDVAGAPGARLTALMAAVAGPAPRAALAAWRADAAAHPSPNAGPVEASFAGALGLRLGGTLSYAGRVEHRPVLNPAGRTPEPADIARAVRLSRRVSVLSLAVTLLGRAAFQSTRGAR